MSEERIVTPVLISQIKEKDQISQTFLLREKSVGIGKTGKPFMMLTLGDSSGILEARLWDNVEDIAKQIEKGDFVSVKGTVQLFQGRKQLVISKIARSDDSSLKIEEFIKKSSFDPNDLYAELVSFVKEISSDHIRQLVQDVINDSDIKPLLLKAPAAKTIHHAWFGGLLEHIVSILKIMKFLSSHYDFINRDLLYFGAIFHDIGKVWELEYETSFGYTTRGRLLGHMELACELVDKKSARIMGFSNELKDICKHIILSHHGKLEYGSPKRPKFIEAFLVAYIDDLDSKMATLNQFFLEERNSTQGWSKYSELFERYFLVEDLKGKFL